MKKYLFSLFCLLYINIIIGQTEENNVKYIEVIGSAEMDVIPDEIYLEITAKEYKKDKEKVTLENIEKQLKDAILSLKIDLSNLQVSNFYGVMLRHKRKDADLLSTKKYQLKLNRISIIDSLVAKLDEININDLGIARVNSSKIAEYRKELKIKAIKAAKEKADLMLGAINEKPGGAILVKEIESSSQDDYTRRIRNSGLASSNSYANDEYYFNPPGNDELTFQKIKLRFEVLVRFQIL
jgi:uncharacterized protein